MMVQLDEPCLPDTVDQACYPYKAKSGRSY